jgi:hypothetical protein
MDVYWAIRLAARSINEGFHDRRQVFLNPVYRSHHLQGSETQMKTGIQYTSRTTPEEKP